MKFLSKKKILSFATVISLVVSSALGLFFANFIHADSNADGVTITFPTKILLGDPDGDCYSGSSIWDPNATTVTINNTSDKNITSIEAVLAGAGEVTCTTDSETKANIIYNIPTQIDAGTEGVITLDGVLKAAENYTETDQILTITYKLEGDESTYGASQQIHFYQKVGDLNNLELPEAVPSAEFEIVNNNNNNENFFMQITRNEVVMDISENLSTQNVNFRFKSLYPSSSSDSYLTRVYYPKTKKSNDKVRNDELLPRLYTYFDYEQFSHTIESKGTDFEEILNSDRGNWVSFADFVLDGTPKEVTNGRVEIHMPIYASYMKKNAIGIWSSQRNTYSTDFGAEESDTETRKYSNVVFGLTIYDKSALKNIINDIQTKIDIADTNIYDTSFAQAAIDQAISDVYNVRLTDQATIDAEVAELQPYLDNDFPLYPADYTGVEAAIEAATNEANRKVEGTDDYLYTEDSREAVDVAINAVEYGKKIIEQDIVDSYAAAINAAKEALEINPADYTAVYAAIDAAEAEINRTVEVAGGDAETTYYYYSQETRSALQTAIDAVQAGKKINEQADVDAWETAITTATDNLALAGAYYDPTDEAIDAAEAERDKKVEGTDDYLYSADSRENVTVAIDAVERDKTTEEQDVINGYYNAINAAKNALEIASADYTGVEAAKAAAIAERDKKIEGTDDYLYTDASRQAVTDAINAVIEGKDITEQSVVDGYAAAINAAKDALEINPADYTAVDEAIVAAEAKRDTKIEGADDYLYTPESRQAVTDAINAVIEGKDITEQSVVDGYAAAINAAKDALEVVENNGEIEWVENQTYEIGKDEDAIVKIKYYFSLFEKATVDGEEIGKDTDYKLVEGSTIIILKSNYLNTLATGTHTLSVYYTNGASFSTTFTITKNDSGDDDDDSDIVVPDTGYTTASKDNIQNSQIFIVSIIGLALLVAVSVKKSRNDRS